MRFTSFILAAAVLGIGSGTTADVQAAEEQAAVEAPQEMISEQDHRATEKRIVELEEANRALRRQVMEMEEAVTAATEGVLSHNSRPILRKAFVMSVKPGQEEEYERRHNPIWEDLHQVLKDHGVSNYSIFLDPETRNLFGYAEIEDEERWNAIAETEPCKRWWVHMKD